MQDTLWYTTRMKKEKADQLSQLSEDNYNRMAREFSNTRAFFWKELKHLRDHVDNGMHIADIGCGNGRLLSLFEEIDITFTGIDSSKELIAIAKETYIQKKAHATFIQADARTLPLSNGSIDTLFSIGMIHHVPSHHYREQCLSEMFRVIKPGGTLIITTWNMWHPKFYKKLWNATLSKIKGNNDLDFGDIVTSFGKQNNERFLHAYTKRGFKKDIKKVGFTNIKLSISKRKSGYSNIVITAEKPNKT